MHFTTNNVSFNETYMIDVGKMQGNAFLIR